MNQGRIFTITGVSGSGKTTIARQFITSGLADGSVVSHTTRGPRKTDINIGIYKEYEYNLALGFFDNTDKFLWIYRENNGPTYGTATESVMAALAGGVHLMLLVPNVIPVLRDAVAEMTGESDRVESFYILSPGEDELRRRLYKRGEIEEFVERRMVGCRTWDQEALNSEIPYLFIDNEIGEDNIEKAVQKIRKHI